ncbi:MAG: pyridoxal phosphate enzyme (YggS family) [Bacteroidia bacterium]|jgi:pyridoxal phosphate enzyme (YggS family)
MIQQNINRIKEELGETVLVAVSKYRTLHELNELYETGQRIFAENRVQELLSKVEALPKDIEWHLIGHLQTNKVKSVISKVSLIHSVDSLKLIKEIQKESAKAGIMSRMLLQIHVATEDSKFGFDPSKLVELTGSGTLNDFPNIQFCGIMSMATLTEDVVQIESEFKKTIEVFEKLKSHMPNPSLFKELSMGMSSDYKIALKKGATMVRIGSKIFVNT